MDVLIGHSIVHNEITMHESFIKTLYVKVVYVISINKAHNFILFQNWTLNVIKNNNIPNCSIIEPRDNLHVLGKTRSNCRIFDIFISTLKDKFTNLTITTTCYFD